MPKFEWTIDGECHRPHSNPEYQPESASGTIEAEGAGEALEKMAHGIGVPLLDSIPWDLIDQFRPIRIIIQPVPGSEDGDDA